MQKYLKDVEIQLSFVMRKSAGYDSVEDCGLSLLIVD